MATTCVLLCAGLAAVLSSTYSIKKPLNDAVFGAHGDFAISIKYLTILTIFIFSFFFHSLSIRFLNQVAILVNIPYLDPNPTGCFFLTSEHVSEMFEKGIFLNTVGNRLFYAGFSLMLWIFGPILVFSTVLVMVLVLSRLDFVSRNNNKEKPPIVDFRRASDLTNDGEEDARWVFLVKGWCLMIVHDDDVISSGLLINALGDFLLLWPWFYKLLLFVFYNLW